MVRTQSSERCVHRDVSVSLCNPEERVAVCVLQSVVPVFSQV